MPPRQRIVSVCNLLARGYMDWFPYMCTVYDATLNFLDQIDTSVIGEITTSCSEVVSLIVQIYNEGELRGDNKRNLYHFYTTLDTHRQTFIEDEAKGKQEDELREKIKAMTDEKFLEYIETLPSPNPRSESMQEIIQFERDLRKKIRKRGPAEDVCNSIVRRRGVERQRKIGIGKLNES